MSSKSLQSLMFLNTRPELQSGELSRMLSKRGGEVCEFPALEIADISLGQLKQLADELEAITSFDWVVFTSANGATHLAEGLKAIKRSDIFERLKICRIAVIGEQTAQSVKRLGLRPSFVAAASNSEAFSSEFLVELENDELARSGGFGAAESVCVYLVRGNLASEKLPQELEAGEVAVKSLVVYQSVVPKPSEEAYQVLKNWVKSPEWKSGVNTGGVGRFRGLLILTSSQAVRNFVLLCEKSGLDELKPAALHNISVAVVGPKTAKTVAELGLNLKVIAQKASAQSLVEGIVSYYTRGQCL